jgi:hypothetical protein
MLDGVKAGTLGEHPAGENALHLAGQLHLVDLDEGRGVGRFGRRTGVADPRRHLERAELDRLVDGNLEMGDAAGHLVEGGEHRNRVLDDLGLGGIGGNAKGQNQARASKEKRAGHAASAKALSLHHTAHLLNGPVDDRSGALLKPQTPRP